MAQQPKRAPRRPTNDERAAAQSRPVRIPVGKARDKLSVTNDRKTMDGKFALRWVKDTSEDGHRIMTFRDAGYEFVRPEDGYRVAKVDNYVSEHNGSVFRKSAGFGEWLYLMKQPIEYHLEDKAAKRAINKAQIDAMQPKSRRGKDLTDETQQYGEMKISTKLSGM